MLASHFSICIKKRYFGASYGKYNLKGQESIYQASQQIVSQPIRGSVCMSKAKSQVLFLDEWS